MGKSNQQIANELKEIYSKWKRDSISEKGYFIIFNGFKTTDKLKDISGNALKLYIYLGLNSNNYTGEVWHTNATIATYFGKSERTIRGWMQELESLNLIKRFQLEFNQESHTFLQPYSNFEPSKYVYIYRLKDKRYREIIDLTAYEDDIKLSIDYCFSDITNKYYIKIKPSYFQISSFSPIPKKYLRDMGKFIKNSNKDFERYIKTYTFIKKDGSIGENHHLFERVKNKIIE